MTHDKRVELIQELTRALRSQPTYASALAIEVVAFIISNSELEYHILIQHAHRTLQKPSK